ncbi:Co2+/Mg2+ efflux protein ApaG [Psychrobium sp. 1_MG-2023]|uniref:Co2+/Mg2+ efflux protein ApaG n=1 Tax=Psychrobium sp. 1_MG-2023 TaxID=3062624 RepID=UPI000C3495D3|nr:Co2+/Mg2+ efflux protein ApaG [Psychrobium sp. 1_MG-2023]MDP2559585.1 Co2+/Mg2+ efflux protein ApaG [Psychrobium sp. 1_MG-2023]PKF59419.1 Co2+/Mg2+ efflux protein ApaG [Alteromonadales bacterium alter-6D02]
MQLSNLISVQVNSNFIEQREADNQTLYVFGYHITIVNNSNEPVQLLRRHWLITDSDGNQSEVEGEGVVGLQPTIEANGEFQYSSGSTFKTQVGTMQGKFMMVDATGQPFDVAIEPFLLADSTMIH